MELPKGYVRVLVDAVRVFHNGWCFMVNIYFLVAAFTHAIESAQPKTHRMNSVNMVRRRLMLSENPMCSARTSKAARVDAAQ